MSESARPTTAPFIWGPAPTHLGAGADAPSVPILGQREGTELFALAGDVRDLLAAGEARQVADAAVARPARWGTTGAVGR